MMATLHSAAQTKTSIVTAYTEFQPAVVYQADGHKLNLPKANIFLKNSSLIYISGELTKEASTKNLMRVDFEDRSYIRIDSVLAYEIDSVGKNVLYCAKMLDLKAYKQLLVNNSTITNLDLSDLTNMNLLNYTAIDMTNVQDIHFPVIPVYYYRLDGKYILVHERHVKRVLDKERRRRMESVMNMPGFSWTDETFLLKILEVIK